MLIEAQHFCMHTRRFCAVTLQFETIFGFATPVQRTKMYVALQSDDVCSLRLLSMDTCFATFDCIIILFLISLCFPEVLLSC